MGAIGGYIGDIEEYIGAINRGYIYIYTNKQENGNYLIQLANIPIYLFHIYIYMYHILLEYTYTNTYKNYTYVYVYMVVSHTYGDPNIDPTPQNSLILGNL